MKLLFTVVLLLHAALGAVSSASDGDPVAGKQKSAQCVACHGTDGNGANPEWPKIAGQSKQYIVRQLHFFKNSERTNPLMNPQAMTLSDRDIEDLAAYFEAQKTSPGVADETLFELGQSIYRGGNPKAQVPACISCHSPNGAGNPAAGFPKLSHQHAAYVVTRLKQYRSGAKYPGAEIMNGVAVNLRDNEIEAVASYIQGLH